MRSKRVILYCVEQVKYVRITIRIHKFQMQGVEHTKINTLGGNTQNTLSLSIEGPYLPLAKFRKVLDSFFDLLTEVDRETSDDGQLTVEWEISSIRAGSIHLTATANPIDEKIDLFRPKQILRTLTEGIDQLQEAPLIPNGFSYSALNHARTLAKIIDPRDFAEISFRSNGWNKNIAPRLVGNIDEITKTTYKSYGSIEGILISISVAGKQKIGIRNLLEGKTIQCYFKDELFEDAKNALRQRVYVFGLIRQHLHGTNIQVEELKILPSVEETPDVSQILARLRHNY